MTCGRWMLGESGGEKGYACEKDQIFLRLKYLFLVRIGYVVHVNVGIFLLIYVAN